MYIIISCQIRVIADFAKSATALLLSRNRQFPADYAKSAAICRKCKMPSEVCPLREMGNRLQAVPHHKSRQNMEL